MNAKVSVVIPVFNSFEPLRRALECLCQQQTHYSYEVVVVDDGSTIDFSSLIEKFSDQIALIWKRIGKNSGPAVARNFGVANANGEIILFTDADCQPAPDWLEKMAVPFSDPGVTGVKGVYTSQQGDLWAKLAQLEFEERYELLASQDEIDFIDTYSGGYRKKSFLEAGGFDTSFARPDNEDVDLSFRVKKAGGRFVFVPDAIVGHTHREGWLAYAKLKYGRGFWRMKVYSRHPEKAVKDSYTPFSLKAQLLLLAILPIAITTKSARFLWKTAWLFSCVPLMRLALPERPLLAVVAPVFCFTRAAALLLGMLRGLFAVIKTS